MIARTLRVDVGPDDLDPVLEAYREDIRPIHERAAGLRQHYVLVDREHGRIDFVGIWESTDAVAASGPELEPARARLWERFGQDPTLGVHEVVDTLR
jgi:quinol monooxygenase YgiN